MTWILANQDWLASLAGYVIAHVFPPKTVAGRLGAVLSALAQPLPTTTQTNTKE